MNAMQIICLAFFLFNMLLFDLIYSFTEVKSTNPLTMA